MVALKSLWLWINLLQTCYGYVDFGDLTRVKVTPTVTIPRPHQVSDVWQPAHTWPQRPMITAVAPFLTLDDNGTHGIFWSTAYHYYSRHFQNARGIFRRQNGVFQGDASLLATCTACNGGDTTATNVCRPVKNKGILGGSVASNTGTACYGLSYTGALLPISTSGLPCCSSCAPRSNITSTISGGVLAPTGSADATTTMTITTSSTVLMSGGSTVTVINQTSTLPPVTISVTTIVPTNLSDAVSPIVTTVPATVVGCGTASGSGTVVGSGTVYLGPGGIIPVTSSGTVSGFASKVIGCGTMIATTGSFIGTATVVGCGTGTGCAVLTGIGTIYPNLLGGFIGITSSGIASGCGKVVGCGTLTGTGTFQITEAYTTTLSPTPTMAVPTVEVYISYCPPDPMAAFRMGFAANLTSTPTPLPQPPGHAPAPYALNNTTFPFPPSNLTSPTSSNTNTTSNSTLPPPSSTNPICQICPSDSGICCPLDVACGADGHCPYVALRKAGYLRFGVNIVDKDNSSVDLGMVAVPGRVAPGLMWVNARNGDGNGTGSDVVKREAEAEEQEDGNGDGKDDEKAEGPRRLKRHRHGYGHGHRQGR